MFVKVPLDENGLPDVGNRHIFIGLNISDTEAVCEIDDGELLPGWIELTEEEFKQYIPEVEPESTPPTIEEQIYAKTLYQTALLELQALGGDNL